MSQARAESLLKSITGHIVQQCAARGHAVSEPLAAFMVTAVVLDPRNGFSADRTLTKEDVQKLQELCLDKLWEECSPSLDTIKMQLYFEMNYASRREFFEVIHQAEESKLSPLCREITDSRGKTRGDLDALYRKIVTYILLRSAMGSPTDTNTVEEATAVLQSIFPQTELGAFMGLLKRDQEQQLDELTMIVTGIRLFNEASKRGEEEVNIHELMPAALKGALAVTSERIENELRVTQTLVYKYTAVLERLTNPEVQLGQADVPVALLREALYNVRQHEVFLKMLQADAYFCAKRVEILQREVSSQMKLLKEAMQAKMAVPTAKVFPLFKMLSKLWSGLRDEGELLNILNNIMLSLQPFLGSQAQIFSEAYLDSMLEDSEVKTDEQRMLESSDDRIDPVQLKTQEWLFPETTASFNELPLQYNGLCGYTLVNRDGLLLPGNPNIGVLKHKEKLYVFTSKEAAVKFAFSPDSFVSEVAEKAKFFPELIHLLKLQQFSCLSLCSEMQPREGLVVKPIIKCESGTQTEIHPVEKNIVKSYEWNEWELRRKALKLADLLSRVTVSVQTDLSHMRRENATQTWLPRNAACQSKREGASNVPKPQTYVAGLRGQRGAHVVKANLTRPVDD
ncbi:cilia- and flagella-associated protein 206 isoform X2 [Archocentrus centrarchus]|uniref:cilia- and flagella-associated protein 206 isoform X2 n=1 Tax=Archocentrus centrarchus TaxID=63155 RepID=UPI0011E9EE37|nr:cilia- and flagella-associated protein 206 isoform X2 [Archocentrus centrarchus]